MIIASWSKPGSAISQSIAVLFAGSALREGDGDAVVGAEQQPPDVGAERPAVIGLDHHAVEVRQASVFSSPFGIGDADARRPRR